MKTIWKYLLKDIDSQTLLMPQEAEVLTAQMQGETLCLWALVKLDAPKVSRTIEMLSTGNPAPDVEPPFSVERKYIATVQIQKPWDDGPLVWHVFERLRDAQEIK